MDRLYAAGALEVFYVPVQMKKNRPGTLLTVVAPPERRAAVADVVFRETTTIGVRYQRGATASAWSARCVTVETPLGAVRFKVARRDGRVLNAAPEFEDCARAGGGARPAGQGRAGAGGQRLAERPRLQQDRREMRFYPDDRDRLRQQPAAPRHGVREDCRRRHRPLQAAARLRDALPDGQRRALAERVQEGARRAGSIRSRTATRWSRCSATAWARLDISFDDFIRTTEPRHQRRRARELAQRIYDAGDIYEGVYEGWYCVGCEEFKQEKDLVDGNCPLHPTLKPEWIREKNYFFRLSKYQQPLLDHFAAHPGVHRSRTSGATRSCGCIEGGLEDISVSRAGQSWGIPLPFDPRASSTSGSTR